MTSEELLEAESQKGETRRQRALCVRVESDREATQRGLSCGLRWRCAPLPRCPCAAALPKSKSRVQVHAGADPEMKKAEGHRGQLPRRLQAAVWHDHAFFFSFAVFVCISRPDSRCTPKKVRATDAKNATHCTVEKAASSSK